MSSEKAIIEGDKLVALAWKVFCKTFPEQIKRVPPEKLERFKDAWTVGYYFSLNPTLKPVKQKIEELLAKAQEASVKRG